MKLKDLALNSSASKGLTGPKEALDGGMLWGGASVNANLSIKVLLQGPYDSTTGRMRTVLNQKKLIPLEYDQGKITQDFMDANPSIIDWIQVSLVDKKNKKSSDKMVLVKDNGEVVDTDGSSVIAFKDVLCDSPDGLCEYVIKIKHRNHLEVMTEKSYTFLNDDVLSLDFINESIASDLLSPSLYGLKNVASLGASPIYALYAGDVDNNGNVSYLDAMNDGQYILESCLDNSAIKVVMNTYSPCDTNLDGIIRYSGPSNDRSIILVSLGGGTIPYIQKGL
jgi:hypothetical protein